ncbi:MAG: hypothetical protein QW255_05210 [Candidatus Bilamarchaeaceae archaeon]
MYKDSNLFGELNIDGNVEQKYKNNNPIKPFVMMCNIFLLVNTYKVIHPLKITEHILIILSENKAAAKSSGVNSELTERKPKNISTHASSAGDFNIEKVLCILI